MYIISTQSSPGPFVQLMLIFVNINVQVVILEAFHVSNADNLQIISKQCLFQLAFQALGPESVAHQNLCHTY
jgi:hypothetical protein